MVGLDEETSNQFYEEIIALNDYLEDHVPYFQEPKL